jgi:arylsulfatase A-like enzyme
VVAPCATYATTQEIDDAIERINAVPEPFFAYVALSAAHGPMIAPPDELITVPLPERPNQADYVVSMLEAADTEIARLLASIPPDVLARTTVVVLGDNGTADQAITPPWNPRRAKASLYEAGVRVPLIVSGPLVAQPGSRVESMVEVVDLLPTIAEIAGIDPTAITRADGAPVTLDGTSFVRYLADPTAPPTHEHMYAERFSPNGRPPYTVADDRMLRDADYKVILNALNGHVEFFELTPGVVDEGPDLLASGVPLDTMQQAALDRLLDEVREITDAMPFDGTPQ